MFLDSMFFMKTKLWIWKSFAEIAWEYLAKPRENLNLTFYFALFSACGKISKLVFTHIHIHGPCRRISDDQNGEDTRAFAESSYITQLRV